ncbi:MAG: hypothetical protein Q7S48_00920 [bacterium]|nr:hypothetical protein [bacterium]
MAKDNDSEVLEAIQLLGTHLDKSIAESQKKTTQQIGKLRSDLIDFVGKRVLRAQDEITKTVNKRGDERIGKVEERIIKVDGRIGKVETQLSLLGEVIKKSKEEIVKEVRTDKERTKLFTEKLLIILERNKLAAPEELRVLKELTV